MIKDVKIGDQTVAMAANAATPIRFATVFHADPMRGLSELQKGGNAEGDATNLIMKLGYIMAMTAERKDFAKLSEEDYIEWLEQFELMDFIAAANDIIAVYLGNKEMLSSSKKK